MYIVDLSYVSSNETSSRTSLNYIQLIRSLRVSCNLQKFLHVKWDKYIFRRWRRECKVKNDKCKKCDVTFWGSIILKFEMRWKITKVSKFIKPIFYNMLFVSCLLLFSPFATVLSTIVFLATYISCFFRSSLTLSRAI